MGKEILFKGKRADNREWIEGYYCFIRHTGKSKHYIVPNYTSALYGIEIDFLTVRQYIGLTDKNNIRIYEGDIISAYFKTNNRKQIFKVIFRNGAFQLDNGYVAVGFADVYNLNVIGNVYDNFELLKEI